MLQQLRRLRNSLSPWATLPGEILSEFFRFASFNQTSGTYVGERVQGLSHVCREWRYAILSDGQLWSYIQIRPSSTLEKINMFLERSKAVPLNVVCLHSISDVPQLETVNLGWLSGHIHRIRSLQVTLSDHHENSLIPLTELDEPAACLESLDVFHPYYDEYSCPLPLMFDGHIPQLRHLSLFGLQPWPFLICHNLTSLALSYLYEMEGEAFLDLLDRSPELIEVTLECCNIAESYTSARSSHLPNLAHLELSETYSPATLAHLRLPEASCMVIRGTTYYSINHRNQNFECNLINCIPDDCNMLHSLRALTSVELSKVSRQITLLLDGDMGSTTISEVDLSHMYNVPSLAAIWLLCLQAIPQTPLFSNLQTRLTLEWEPCESTINDPTTHHSVYRAVFVAMPGLQEITLKMSGISDPLEALCVPADGSHSDEENPGDGVVCPELRLLSVDPTDNNSDGGWFEVLERVVNSRNRGGFPIENLQLTSRTLDRAVDEIINRIQGDLLELIDFFYRRGVGSLAKVGR